MDMVTMETVIQDIASKSLIHLCVWHEDLFAIATYVSYVCVQWSV